MGQKRKIDILLSRAIEKNAIFRIPAVCDLILAENMWNSAKSKGSYKNIPEMWAFFGQHPKVLSDILAKASRSGDAHFVGRVDEINAEKKLREVLEKKGALKKEPNQFMLDVLETVSGRVYNRAHDDVKSILRKRLINHIANTRGIPFDERAFSIIFDKYKYFDGIIVPALLQGAVTLGKFEGLYLGILKTERGIQSNFGQVANSILNDAFHNRVVTKEVISKKKKWIMDKSKEFVYGLMEESVHKIHKNNAVMACPEMERFKQLSIEFEALSGKKLESFSDSLTKSVRAEAVKYPLHKRAKVFAGIDGNELAKGDINVVEQSIC